ncbi:MAG: YjfB family protein [Clostridium sp.]|nr:YjfB family protein [Clostridium sp.]MCM1398602.1 YjfB family protein [Clostridium sp.]MCM1459890.1 YjfB family protein [Bacteroides sp.]
MNINALSSTNLSISDTRSMNVIDISLLKKSLDSAEVSGDMITKMMEQSVNPNIGANVDVRI